MGVHDYIAKKPITHAFGGKEGNAAIGALDWGSFTPPNGVTRAPLACGSSAYPKRMHCWASIVNATHFDSYQTGIE